MYIYIYKKVYSIFVYEILTINFISFHLMQQEQSQISIMNDHIDNYITKNKSVTTRWNRIIILDKNKHPINDQIYYLDHKARLLTKFKRQKRRDLGKVTGKKKVPKNWKQIIENLDDAALSSLNILNESTELLSESPSNLLSSSDQDHETQQIDFLSFDKLISIDWLLNQPTAVSAI